MSLLAPVAPAKVLSASAHSMSRLWDRLRWDLTRGAARRPGHWSRWQRRGAVPFRLGHTPTPRRRGR